MDCSDILAWNIVKWNVWIECTVYTLSAQWSIYNCSLDLCRDWILAILVTLTETIKLQ